MSAPNLPEPGIVHEMLDHECPVCRSMLREIPPLRIGYTADQMHEMWRQGLEDAAKVCKEEEDRFWRAYKGHGEPHEKGNPHTEGASDQCAVLADAIRRLKDTL